MTQLIVFSRRFLLLLRIPPNEMAAALIGIFSLLALVFYLVFVPLGLVVFSRKTIMRNNKVSSRYIAAWISNRPVAFPVCDREWKEG